MQKLKWLCHWHHFRYQHKLKSKDGLEKLQICSQVEGLGATFTKVLLKLICNFIHRELDLERQVARLCVLPAPLTAEDKQLSSRLNAGIKGNCFKLLIEKSGLKRLKA